MCVYVCVGLGVGGGGGGHVGSLFHTSFSCLPVGFRKYGHIYYLLRKHKLQLPDPPLFHCEGLHFPFNAHCCNFKVIWKSKTLLEYFM